MNIQTPQDGWNAAMLWVGELADKYQFIANRDKLATTIADEIGRTARNMVGVPPVVPTKET